MYVFSYAKKNAHAVREKLMRTLRAIVLQRKHAGIHWVNLLCYENKMNDVG